MHNIPAKSLAGDYLVARGIDLAFAAEHGVEWSCDMDLAWERLGLATFGGSNRDEKIPDSRQAHRDSRIRSKQHQFEECLSFPIHGYNGASFNKLFPLRDGDKTKGFRTTRGAKQPLFIPEETWDARRDSTCPIFLTEGPVKALAIFQAGGLSIGLNGTYASENVEGRRFRQLMRLLREKFEWFGRRVYLAFDADQFGNKGVRRSILRHYLMFTMAGADVRQLTSWPLTQGKGIDDYLVGQAKAENGAIAPADALQVLIEVAEGKSFVEGLLPRDLEPIAREFRAVKMDEVWFSRFTRQFAKPLGVRIGAFGSRLQEESSEQQESSLVDLVTAPPPAEPWPEEVVPSQVLEEIRTTLLRHVWMKPSQSRAVTLLIVLGYLHDVVSTLPILLVTSPEPECGKSTLLQLVYYLAYRPLTASNISTAAVFHVIHKDCPTLVLDEAETYLLENEALRGVINSGHKRLMAYVIRVIDDQGNTGRYPTWCPKVIAMVGRPKQSILSRSIHIKLQRKDRSQETEVLEDDMYEAFTPLRRKIARLANQIRDSVKEFKTDLLSNRSRDNWRALLAIAHAAGREWEKAAVSAALKLQEQARQTKDDFRRYLVEIIGRVC